MKVNLLPTQEYLSQLLEYNPEAGTLHWLPQPGKRCNNVRDRAGCFTRGGYRSIRIDGCLYQEHRIILVINNGQIPDGLVVDHIDRNPENNKLNNLRLVTSTINNINRNSKGVSYDKARNKWKAQLTMNGKPVINKRFDTYEEALFVYEEVKSKLI